MAEAGLARGSVRDIVHGSTTGTNALIERTGARTGLLTTAGFRDVLEIGRVMRPMEGIYDMSVDRPPPLVPRRRCLEAIERIGPRGEIIVPLDVASVERAAESFARQEVEAVAICFLFSFLNPEHERRAAEILARRLQGVAISQSHRISPEYREYERASTAVMNAYLSPVMTDYLDRLNARIAKSVRRCEAVRHSGKRRGNDGRNRAFLRGCDGELRPGRRRSRGRMVWSAAPTRAHRVGRYGRHELRHRPGRAWRCRRSRRKEASRACRSSCRSSICISSAPAAARSPGSIPAARSMSARGRPVPSRGRRAMAAAAGRRRSPMPTWCSGGSILVSFHGGRTVLDRAAAKAAVAVLADRLGLSVEDSSARHHQGRERQYGQGHCDGDGATRHRRA